MTSTPQSQHDAVKSALKEQMAAAQRELDIIEKYEALMKKRASVTKEAKPNGVSPASKLAATLPFRPSASTLARFDQLTKEGAAVEVLSEFGEAMAAPAIFSAMKERGHPVKNLNSLRSLLEKSTKFIKIGSLWDLASKSHP